MGSAKVEFITKVLNHFKKERKHQIRWFRWHYIICWWCIICIISPAYNFQKVWWLVLLDFFCFCSNFYMAYSSYKKLKQAVKDVEDMTFVLAEYLHWS